MTVWICSYPRSGNSLVATSLLATGDYRYEQHGADMTRPDGIERAIAAGALPSRPDGELILKTHRVADLDAAGPDDTILVPVRDGRDVLLSYWHYDGAARAPDMVTFWNGLHTNGHRWDDWMRELEPHRRSGAAACGLTGALDGFPCRAGTMRFESMAAERRWTLGPDGYGLRQLDPRHFRSGQPDQWRDLPDAERAYLNRELGPTLAEWGYT